MNKNVCTLKAIRNCTGCGVCASICGVGAITIKETKDGFYEPVVDELKCVNCSLCTKVCYKFDSQYNTIEVENYECYSAVNKNENELKSSSSGGMSSALMKQCLANGYHVVGVMYDKEKERAVTKIATCDEELEQFKGAKYFQSYTVDAFKKIISDNTKQKYAIFGTPCQIYALSKVAEIKKNRHKYLFVDIFCHGCPSLKLWDKYLRFIKNKNKIDTIDNIKFRSKSYGWHEYAFEFVTKERKIVSSKYDDPFFELFFGMDLMNNACYDCIARSTIEKTDLRIGDFWGKRFDLDTKGVSAVVVSTDKGKELLDSIKTKIDIQIASFDEIIKAQSYKKIHNRNVDRVNYLRNLIISDKDIVYIVKKRRKMLPLKTNLKRILKKNLKLLPTSIYLKIKTKLK